MREANEILNQLKEHPEAWQRVDAILQYSSSQQTKFYGLQILESGKSINRLFATLKPGLTISDQASS